MKKLDKKTLKELVDYYIEITKKELEYNKQLEKALSVFDGDIQIVDMHTTTALDNMLAIIFARLDFDFSLALSTLLQGCWQLDHFEENKVILDGKEYIIKDFDTFWDFVKVKFPDLITEEED